MQAIFAGTFDPPTRGHLDLITRASKLCQRLLVAVNAGVSESKKPLFSIEERLALLKEEVTALKNVEVMAFSGLLTEFAKSKGIHTIIRGVRNSIDWDYETQLAYMNSRLYTDLEVIFLAAKPEYAFVRASWVREIAAFGGDVSAFVTPSVAAKLLTKR
jgi:pantetheine-phosphate adenylyltransferase